MLQLELRQISGNTYYIPSKVNVGLYIEDGEAVLINSGSDKDTAREILRLLNEFEWQLKLIVNTQGIGQHIGGNAFLQEKTGCAVAATEDEASFIENPLLEAALIYGGYPNKELRQKLEISKASKVTDYLGEEGPIADTPLTFKFAPGRSFDAISVITPEKVIFLGETLMPEEALKTCPLSPLWDIRLQLQTLQELKKLDVEACVISQGDAVYNFKALVELNEQTLQNNINDLLKRCKKAQSLDHLVAVYLKKYPVENASTFERPMRLAATLKNYVAYLQEEGWVQVSNELDQGGMMVKTL